MRQTLQQLFNRFIYEAEFSRKSSPATLRGYKTTFETLLNLMPNISLELLSAQTMTQFFQILQERKRIVGKGAVKSGIKKSTLATYWRKLNVFFEWLLVNEHIKTNPFQGMKCPMPEYENKQYLKKEEVEKILSAIHMHHSKRILLFKRNLVIFYLLLFCGLRKEELLLLQIRDIDFERKMLTIRAETSKSKRDRLLPLHSTTLMHLRDYLQDRRAFTTPYLIVSSTRDGRFTENGLKHLVSNIRNLSKVPFHLHQFRHTFAVNFLQTSNNIFKLKMLLGHRDISVTMVYLRCLPVSDLREDVEALRIDTFL